MQNFSTIIDLISFSVRFHSKIIISSHCSINCMQTIVLKKSCATGTSTIKFQFSVFSLSISMHFNQLSSWHFQHDIKQGMNSNS